MKKYSDREYMREGGWRPPLARGGGLGLLAGLGGVPGGRDGLLIINSQHLIATSLKINFTNIENTAHADN
jgi:hypothetical protein